MGTTDVNAPSSESSDDDHIPLFEPPPAAAFASDPPEVSYVTGPGASESKGQAGGKLGSEYREEGSFVGILDV